MCRDRLPSETEPSCDLFYGESCVNGLCFRNCHGSYVDTTTNKDRCGACGNVCQPRQMCDNGICKPCSCPSNLTCCIGCVDTNTDEKNCGASGQTCQDGQCV